MVWLTGADLQDAAVLLRALERELSCIVMTSGAGDWFVFYDPDRVSEPENRFPFATVVTVDRYDVASAWTGMSGPTG